jgi:hypothetical protein
MKNQQLASLIEASKVLTSARISVCKEPLPVWVLVSHALDHINKQVEVEMRGEVTL